MSMDKFYKNLSKLNEQELLQVVDYVNLLIKGRNKNIKKIVKQDVIVSPSIDTNYNGKFKKTNKQNLFESLSDYNSFKADSQIDKKLSKGLRATQRRRSVNFVSVTCSVCGIKQDISPSLVPPNESGYYCNSCSRSRG